MIHASALPVKPDYGTLKYTVRDGVVRDRHRNRVRDKAIIEALVPQPKQLWLTLACCGSAVRIDHYPMAALHWSRCLQGYLTNRKLPHTRRLDREAGPYTRDTEIRRPRRQPVRCPEPLVRIPLKRGNPTGMSFVIKPWNTAVEILSATTGLELSSCTAKTQPSTTGCRPQSGVQNVGGNVNVDGVNVIVGAAPSSMPPRTSWVLLEADSPIRRRMDSIDAQEDRQEEHDDITLIVAGGDWGPVCRDQRCAHWRLQHRYPCEIG